MTEWIEQLIGRIRVWMSGGDRAVVGSQAGENIITGDYNTIIKMLPDKLTVSEIKALEKSYLSRLVGQCRYLDLSGVDPAAAGQDETNINLNAIYTALLTLSSEGMERTQPERGQRLSALAQLDRHQWLALLGDPGSGKSTFVDFVAICLAGERLGHHQLNLERLTEPLPDEEGKPQEERQPWSQGPLLPVRVVLRDFAGEGLPPPGQPGTAACLWDYIAAGLKADTLGAYVEVLEQMLRHKGGLLLLDGLDEVPEADRRRQQIKQAVEGFRDLFPACRILVTSRIYAYQNQDWRLTDFETATLAPFSMGQIRRFVDRWYEYTAALRHLSEEYAHSQADHLKRVVGRSANLRELAERPLLLTMMARLHAWRSGTLPDRRQELYEQVVDLLLYVWERRKVVRTGSGEAEEPSLVEWLDVDRERIRDYLNELAYTVHARQREAKGTADIKEEELAVGLMKLSRIASQRNPLELEHYLSNRAGLLVPRGQGVYAFPHRSFQEYLAACHLADHPDYPHKLVDLVRQEPERWREVTLLAGARLSINSPHPIWWLVEHLCPAGPPDTGPAEEGAVWTAYLAGQALAETPKIETTIERYQARMERVQAWLEYILAEAALPAVDRARAGQILGRFGDSRPGVGLRADGLPDIIWCDVPAGPFIRGSDKEKDPQAYNDELPQTEVELAAYRIGRYPITNAQYAVFVADGGYTGQWQSCWTEAGWEWKGDRSGPPSYSRPFDMPNHPVVGVTWYEAVAFCRWLTVRLRAAEEIGEEVEISLPSESQWEKAARGVDGRIYPWGEEIDPEQANYDDTGLGTTSAVGCFPAGASPYGCEEMVGNVWEWCRTKWQDSYENYEDDNDLGGSGIRVLRGGSFNDTNPDARCAVRYWNSPFDGNNDGGFRVLLSPFFPSAL